MSNHNDISCTVAHYDLQMATHAYSSRSQYQPQSSNMTNMNSMQFYQEMLEQGQHFGGGQLSYYPEPISFDPEMQKIMASMSQQQGVGVNSGRTTWPPIDTSNQSCPMYSTGIEQRQMLSDPQTTNSFADPDKFTASQAYIGQSQPQYSQAYDSALRSFSPYQSCPLQQYTGSYNAYDNPLVESHVPSNHQVRVPACPPSGTEAPMFRNARFRKIRHNYKKDSCVDIGCGWLTRGDKAVRLDKLYADGEHLLTNLVRTVGDTVRDLVAAVQQSNDGNDMNRPLFNMAQASDHKHYIAMDPNTNKTWVRISKTT